jgi:gentisate 1,2-dioxygenase
MAAQKKSTNKQAAEKRTRRTMPSEHKARLEALGVKRTANRPTGSIIRNTTLATLQDICKGFSGEAIKSEDGVTVKVKAGPSEVVILPKGASTPAKGVKVVKVSGDLNSVKAALVHFQRSTEGAKYAAEYVGGVAYLLK